MRFNLIVSGGDGPGDAKGQGHPLLEAVRRGTLRATTMGMLIASLWVIIGSIIYPLWWYEAIWCGGIFNLLLIRAGINYLLNYQVWFLIGAPVLALALGLCLRWFLAITSRFLDQYGAVMIFICLIGLLIDAVVIRHTQRHSYAVWMALKNVSVALVDFGATLASLAVAPTKIEPPVQFHYMDRTRVAALYSQIEPLLVEREHTVSLQNKKGISAGLGRAPMGINTEAGTTVTEASTYKKIELSPERKCLEVINDLLSRQEPPYFTTARISRAQMRARLVQRALIPFQHEMKMSHSLFSEIDPATISELDMVAHQTLNASRADKDNSAADAEAQLRSISGLVIVEGVFKETPRDDHTASFDELFVEGPRQVWFRFNLGDKAALGLIRDRAKLRVLGDVVRPWDGGRYLELHAIAIF